MCTDSEGPLAIGESQTEPGSVEICPIYKQQQYTLNLGNVTVHNVVRHIPSLWPVLVLVALNTLFPVADSEGPLAIGESQTEPGSVER